MRLATLSLLASSLAVQRAAATFANLWGDNSQPYQCSCSYRAQDQCTDHMHSGWKWESVGTGLEVLDAYAGFYVSGLKVTDNCNKMLTEGSASKCAIAEMERLSAGISITRTDVQATTTGFSIASLHIAATVNIQLEFIYTMTDGSICKHTSNVGTAFSIIENQQCGGAVSVVFKLVETITVSVELTVYSINWECGKPGKGGGGGGGGGGGISPPPNVTPTGVFPPSKSASKTKPPVTPTGFVPTGVVPTGFIPTSSVRPPPPPPPPKGSPSESFPGGPGYQPTLPIGTAPGPGPIPTYYPPSKSVPGRKPGGGPPLGTPSLPGIFPPTSTGVFPTGTLPVGPPVTTPEKKPPGNVPPGRNSPPGENKPPGGNVPQKQPPGGNVCQPTPGVCPPLVPKCLATWLFVTKCATNTDYNCYCEHFEYTKLVIDCINARGCSKFEIDISLSYFVGICAKYIPNNPGIITNLPPNTTLGPPDKQVPVIPNTGGGNSPPPTENAPPNNNVPIPLIPNGGGSIYPPGKLPPPEEKPPTGNVPNKEGPPPKEKTLPPPPAQYFPPGENAPPNVPVPLTPNGGGSIYPPGKPPPTQEKPPVGQEKPPPENQPPNMPGFEFSCPPEVVHCPYREVSQPPPVQIPPGQPESGQQPPPVIPVVPVTPGKPESGQQPPPPEKPPVVPVVPVIPGKPESGQQPPPPEKPPVVPVVPVIPGKPESGQQPPPPEKPPVVPVVPVTPGKPESGQQPPPVIPVVPVTPGKPESGQQPPPPEKPPVVPVVPGQPESGQQPPSCGHMQPDTESGHYPPCINLPPPPSYTPPPVYSTVPVTVISVVTTVEVPVTTVPGIPTGPGIPTPTAPVFVSKIITVPQIRFDVFTVPGPSGPVVETGLVPGPQPTSVEVAPPPFGTGEGGFGSVPPTGFRPVVTPTQAAPSAPPPKFTGAANSNNKAGKVVGGLAGGLAALLLL